MIAISKAICSDDMLNCHKPYLARLGHIQYLVIYPFNNGKPGLTKIPYKEAYYYDPYSNTNLSVADNVRELVEIS